MYLAVDVVAADVAVLAFRIAVGAVFVAHGVNHIVGGGRIAGTARWFESLGMRPGRLHAWLASVTEIVAGLLLVVGLVTPVAAAGVVGVMVVAWVTNHRTNGFFIFRPGEGWEYVMVLTFAGVLLGGVGSGALSLDHALGIFDPPGTIGLVLAILGAVGAAVLLALCWRPDAAEG
jgi:putative oxidoreductase